MADDLIEPHQAKGDLELVAADERDDSIGVADTVDLILRLPRD